MFCNIFSNRSSERGKLASLLRHISASGFISILRLFAVEVEYMWSLWSHAVPTIQNTNVYHFITYLIANMVVAYAKEFFLCAFSGFFKFIEWHFQDNEWFDENQHRINRTYEKASDHSNLYCLLTTPNWNELHINCHTNSTYN